LKLSAKQSVSMKTLRKKSGTNFFAPIAIVISLALLIINIAQSCKHDDKTSGTQPSINTQEEEKWISISGREGITLPFYQVIPQGTGPYPVIIVLHGCGGLLDATTKKIETHFLSWIDFGKNNKVVMIFPDSYNPRGFSSFCNMAPPDDAVCSPAYERTKDVFDVMLWLKNQPYVDINRIGILGFSQGAETALSCIADPAKLIGQRIVSNNGVSYNVPNLVEKPAGITIKAAVTYYPGTVYYGYYKNQYDPTASVLIQAASLDPLYSGGQTQAFVDNAIKNGANSTNSNTIQLVVYSGASHSFDGASSGADGDASTQAATKTTAWFKQHLGF
jgi:dienelactone hydrolase